MPNNIPKELFASVLNWTSDEQQYYKSYEVEDNNIRIYFFQPDSTGKTGTHWWQVINLYEFAYICKEWAYTKGYVLFSKIRLNSSKASCYFDISGIHGYEDDYCNDFRAETEPEAAEWILNAK